MSEVVEEDRLRQLIALGPTLVGELDLDVLLNRLLETACSVTAARYAALGILDAERRELERFITVGLSEDEERVIGERPRGRGVLGVLIHDPRPLRLADVTAHPHSSGFPAGHPPMRSFLGVPILIRGTAWGNLYLTDKRIGEFTDADEHSITTLATWAAIAVDHARLLAGATERETELENAVRRLEATQAVAVAVGAETDLERVLEFIAERGREIVEARSALILLQEGVELVVASRAGDTQAQIGARLPVADSISGRVMLTKLPVRVDDPSSEMRVSPSVLGVPDLRTALLVPMVFRDEALGMMAAFDRDTGSPEFDESDEQVLVAFAATAATAVGQHRRAEQIG
ncbi:MAG TPA: GAF domain-containing protein [Solirubrobacteraceae bacterium]|nr:GAF domain-containing protein [Solirubrobacteraceae bacterium]